MAKLIAVVKDGDYNYSKRQMPLVVEDKLTMVLQFPDSCMDCSTSKGRKSEMDRFIDKYMSLNDNERSAATSINQTVIAEQLACLIPCVGCRRSVERLLDHLAMSGHATLDPMSISMKGKRCQMTLKKSFREDPKLLFAMFYMYGDKLQEFVDTIPRSKKNKRCQLHSLDTQKTKSTSNWVDLWQLLSEECREQILMIDYQKFMEAMIVYLEKHRFCIECKTKVLHAHGLLIGDDGKKKDKSYCPALYEGIKYCKNAKHVHVKNDVEFIANLIARAEPDLMGSRRERHAKTLDIAQEEVLTCLGSYLYVRFNRLLQKIKLEEQTWQQLSYIGICCLRQNFEVELEKKQGISQLELLCSEIELEEKNKEHKKEMKRKKKRKSKQSKQRNRENSAELECEVCQAAAMLSCVCCASAQQSQPGNHAMIRERDETSVTLDRDWGDSHTERCVGCHSLSSISEDNPQHLFITSPPPPLTSPLTSQLTAAITNTTDVGRVCGCDHDTHSDTESEASRSPVHREVSRIFCAVKTSTSDLGYSSGPEGCDSCSVSTNSNDGAVPLIDTVSYCDRHTSEDTSLDRCSCEGGLGGLTCQCAANYSSIHQRSAAGCEDNQDEISSALSDAPPPQSNLFHSTLQDMLEESCENEDTEENEELISEADIAAFKANMSQTNKERLQLREKLKQRFDDRMQKGRHCCNTSTNERYVCDHQ